MKIHERLLPGWNAKRPLTESNKEVPEELCGEIISPPFLSFAAVLFRYIPWHTVEKEGERGRREVLNFIIFFLFSLVIFSSSPLQCKNTMQTYIYWS